MAVTTAAVDSTFIFILLSSLLLSSPSSSCWCTSSSATAGPATRGPRKSRATPGWRCLGSAATLLVLTMFFSAWPASVLERRPRRTPCR